VLFYDSQFNKTERYDVVEKFVTQLITKGKMTDLTPLPTCHILFHILVREDF
jgi:hypothetical protein